MTDKTQRIVAGIVGVALFAGGAALFVISLLGSEPSVAGLVTGGALVAVAMIVASWVVAERTPAPEPIDLTRNRDHRPEESVRGYRPPTSQFPQRERTGRHSPAASPMSRFALALLQVLGAGFLFDVGVETYFSDDENPVPLLLSLALFLGAQYQLIAAGVSRGILDTRD